jgi:hypothetical protein
MEFRELDNVIYRGARDRQLGARMTERIADGKWLPSTPREITAAVTFGTPLTEAQAKEFQGDGWPEA